MGNIEIMGSKFSSWQSLSNAHPVNYQQLVDCIIKNREFSSVDTLNYGDHGLEHVYSAIANAIKANKRIALYADYDVDGTMSCVSWIWFLRSIGFKNYTYYIPDRFTEGYGVNINAVKHLVEVEKAELIITMDTGITANEEASWCLSNGVQFVCTDHHKIQADKMPDCMILNPKTHPDPEYQELCGCGITFVLLRKLAKEFNPPHDVWVDILALTGMATICDVVPLNGVNHRLAKLGVEALLKSHRPVLKKLLSASSIETQMDEKDVGFRLGPRINAVGRLEHANKVIRAFIDEEPGELIHEMSRCNEIRKQIQAQIVHEARLYAGSYANDSILFLGGDWHPGVVGIAASKIAEEFWRPVWLYEKKDGICKGSARSIPGYDVTDAMAAVGGLFTKFGGHAAAGGFSFPAEHEMEIRLRLAEYSDALREKSPEVWHSKIYFDCSLPLELASLKLVDHLDALKPFGHGFEEPRFYVEADVEEVVFYKDKKTGEPRHTAIQIEGVQFDRQKIMFFNHVCSEVKAGDKARFVVTAVKNHFRGTTSLSLIGLDLEVY
ncbi:MAG: DHH family phosphoesterase [Bdellovibrionota bacterium]